jgi:hypothetical protein
MHLTSSTGAQDGRNPNASTPLPNRLFVSFMYTQLSLAGECFWQLFSTPRCWQGKNVFGPQTARTISFDSEERKIANMHSCVKNSLTLIFEKAMLLKRDIGVLQSPKGESADVLWQIRYLLKNQTIYPMMQFTELTFEIRNTTHNYKT